MGQGELFEVTVADFDGMGPLEAFHSLCDEVRWVGYAMAWLHEPMTMTELTDRLAKAGIRTQGGKRIPASLVRESLQVLSKCGVARCPSGGSYHIDWTVSHYLVAEAYENPELLTKLRKLPLQKHEGYSRFNSSYYRYEGWETGPLHAVRDMREKFYDGDAEGLSKVLDVVLSIRPGVSWEFALHPFQGERLRALAPKLFRSAINWCVHQITDDLYPGEELLALMVERAESLEDWRLVGELALFRCNWGTAERAEVALKGIGLPGEVVAMEICGAATFLSGDDEGALSAFEDSMALWRKATRKRKCCPGGLCGVWFVAALLRRGSAEDLAAAVEYARRGAEMYPNRQHLFNCLRDLAEVVSGHVKEQFKIDLKRVAPEWLNDPEPGLYDLCYFILAFMRLRRELKRADCAAALERLRVKAQDCGVPWLAAEASALRDAWHGKPSVEQKEQTADHWARVGPEARPFSTSFRPPEPWERTVLALETLSHELAGKGKKKAGATKRTAAQKQLVWCLRASDTGWGLLPIERTISAKGKVSKGRRVAYKRLKERSAEMPHLTEQDRRVAMHIKRYSSWGGQDYDLNNPKALLDLAGHPLLFADEEGAKPVELVKVSPRLAVTETKKGMVKLELTPKADYRRAEPVLIVESPTRYLVLDCQPVHVRLFELLGQGQAEIPSDAKERVVKALGDLSEQLAIESDEGTLGEVGIETVKAECQPVLRLFPHGEGLHARLLIRPLGGMELSCDPGEGKAMIFSRKDGKQVQARRDLEAERAAAQGILEDCPTFADYSGLQETPWSALLDEPVECLNLLEEIHHLEPESMVVEWPEGQPFRLHSVADTAQFQLSLGGSKEWLTASGKLPLDDELVLTMRQLLELTAASADTPGFIRLDDGQFVALTKQFRRQLEDLRAFSQPGKGEQLRIHPLAALALDELSSHPGVKTGTAWKKQLARLRAVEEKAPPQPPSTLQAELRSYQLDGYRWLRRLADWGMGACLADDMGLGKTVQALALLLDRAPDGPALVVAPTSVAGNWLEETIRFAPTLRAVIFGRQGEDREALLKEAGPFDLIITSYGLLQSEAEAFAGRSWHTVILDEAQAIKNRATKRSQAAMKLEADCRLITTGTPVENRLAELHNLFSFANPGLLGSWDKFRKTFADPIERQQDNEARERLRRLVRPFLLRRLKSEVLRELPSRTEIALQVELTPEEAAFYEALRQKAVDDLNRAKEDGAESGQAAIRILAELMRLRRACCHPKLIDPKSPLPSSKLRVFAETLEEILAGNHKVLVFSQFVDHLRLIREHLDAEKITYQYLDGSTPAAKRQKAVRDFQSGSGEVFLISLKAGGFGLNLTAADYVIHMDPWWNPAAEDQASDRAHRIGQTRPVTIYRLITAGTIEEKIVDLHHRKRELADSILEGTDSAGRLTPDELLDLLRSDE